jgi:hypothetical protein
MDLDKIKTNIKKFFSNPNTLTFLLVIVLIIVIYGVYTYMVKKAVQPVQIPFCKEKLKTMTEITDQYIGQVKISGNFVSASGSELLQQSRQIKNKYVTPGYFIPENSFFYDAAVSDSSVQERTSFSGLPDDYTIYELKNMTFHKTYGCSIMSGNYIDLYFKATDKDNDNKVIFGQFIKSIQVLKVIDKEGLDVFTEATKEEPDPQAIWFAVPTQLFELLQIAERLTDYNVEIIPVPRNSGYTENPEPTKMVNDAIEMFILDNASTKK